MADEITRWSEELARDPSSRVFLQLGEALRRRGQLVLALKIAMRGLERHSHDADAHDLLARIAADRGELERAFDEWDMALRLQPGHVGAMKGLGFASFQLGRLDDAERYLQQAADAGAGDSVRGALDTVRRRSRPTTLPSAALDAVASPRSSNGRAVERDSLSELLRDVVPDETSDELPDAAIAPTHLFVDLLSDGGQAAMLLDEAGLVMAGAYPTAEGTDVAQEVGAELSGVSDEARRATRHLEIGDWRSILVETEQAVVAMMPTGDTGVAREGLVLLAASRATPLGLVRRVLARCSGRARGWLAREAR